MFGECTSGEESAHDRYTPLLDCDGLLYLFKRSCVEVVVKSAKTTMIVILVCLIFPGNVLADSTLTLNTADSSPYSRLDDSGFYDVLLTQVFNNLGLAISINHLPSTRSIFNVNIGIDDGEYARVKGVDENYHNLILVEEKLIDFGFTAFSKAVSVEINNWTDLKDYHVAYINGWQIYEKNVTSYKSLMTVKDQKELFDLLINDRVDLILYEKWRGIDYIKEQGLAGIYPSPEPIEKKAMYLYLHKKHENLVQQVEKALQTLKSEGQYGQLIESILEK